MDEIEEYLFSRGLTLEEGAGYFNADYLTAIVGVDIEGRLVYSYEKMIEWLMDKYGWDEEGAIDWIEFNVLRSIPYMGRLSPIIIHEVADED